MSGSSVTLTGMSVPSFANPKRAARLRASDADREQCAQLLRDAYADGRLDATDLRERSARVWSARTLGDLRTLADDLIGPDEPRVVEPAPEPDPVAPVVPRTRNVFATILFIFSLSLSLAGIVLAVLILQR